MSLIIAQFGFLFLGGLCFAWGFFIMGSDHFYKWWRDRYWKESNNEHLTFGRLVLNRYVEGTGMIGLGIALTYVGVSIN